MAEEFVQVELSTPTSDYALVIFNNTPETYPTDADIDCTYTVTSVLEPSRHDWVGIYKVGWRSAREYHCFDWARMPDDYRKGQKFDVTVTFSASSLPHDDGEFYQFCYVTGSGHVRGASTPFQFRRPGAEEYVEVEDESDVNVLIIKTKTAMLEDKVTKIEQEKEELCKTVEYLEKEKEMLLKAVTEAKDRAVELEKTNNEVAKLQQATAENLDEEKQAHSELVLLHDSLKEKISTLNQEKESCVKRLDESDEYINSLQQKIKTLVNEKDALIGRNKTLEEEKELFNKHFASSEDRIKGYVSELEDLRQKLRDEEATSAGLRKKVESLQDQLAEAKNKLKEEMEASRANKALTAELTEKLHNCEDKLEAANKCKDLLNAEICSLKQTLSKLSQDLENSMSACHNYKAQVTKNQDLMQMYTEKVSSLQKALNCKEEELQEQVTEYRKLKELNWEQEAKDKAREDGAQFALNKAYETLKGRYERMRNQKEEMQKQLEEAASRLRRLEEEKDKVIADMKDRLRLGQEEYQERFIQCQLLQKELKKLRCADKQGSPAHQADKQTATAQQVDKQTATAQQAEPVSGEPDGSVPQGKDLSTSSEMLDDVMGQDGSELCAQLEDLAKELEKRKMKKDKYKNLLQEEREECASAERKYIAEIQRKDDEIQLLRNQLGEALQRRSMQQGQQQVSLPYPVQGPPTGPIPLPSRPPPPPFYPMQNPPRHVYMPVTPVYPPSMRYPYGQGPIMVQGPPLIPPRSRALAASEGALVGRSSAPRSSDGADRPASAEPLHDLDAPVPPLPRPLSPQRSPEAVTAQVKATSQGGKDEIGELIADDEDESFLDAEEGPGQEAAPPSYGSAELLSLPECPICNKVFPMESSHAEMHSHVESHIKICPVCNMECDDLTTDKFTDHVNTHFAD